MNSIRCPKCQNVCKFEGDKVPVLCHVCEYAFMPTERDAAKPAEPYCSIAFVKTDDGTDVRTSLDDKVTTNDLRFIIAELRIIERILIEALVATERPSTEGGTDDGTKAT